MQKRSPLIIVLTAVLVVLLLAVLVAPAALADNHTGKGQEKNKDNHGPIEIEIVALELRSIAPIHVGSDPAEVIPALDGIIVLPTPDNPDVGGSLPTPDQLREQAATAKALGDRELAAFLRAVADTIETIQQAVAGIPTDPATPVTPVAPLPLDDPAALIDGLRMQGIVVLPTNEQDLSLATALALPLTMLFSEEGTDVGEADHSLALALGIPLASIVAAEQPQPDPSLATAPALPVSVLFSEGQEENTTDADAIAQAVARAIAALKRHTESLDVDLPELIQLYGEKAPWTVVIIPQEFDDLPDVKPFLMQVEDVFSIRGRGTVATGRIERSQD